MNEQQTTLLLPIKRQWYEMIKSGVKKEEYRWMKEHWISRLLRYVNSTTKHFDTATLRNGYGKNAPTLVVECLGITVGKGNPDWGAPEEQVFIIKLGKILKETI